MTSHRATFLLDDETRKAARELAAKYGCSLSEAIRRAVLRERARVLGVPMESRQERVRLLQRLFVLFEGNDPHAEIRRLKSEDEGF
jgi:hypothetical protein